MDKKVSLICLIAYFLIIIYYTLNFIEKFNVLNGILITCSVVFGVYFTQRIFLEDESTGPLESHDDTIIARFIKGKKVLIKKILQIGPGKKMIAEKIQGDEVIIEDLKQISK